MHGIARDPRQPQAPMRPRQVDLCNLIPPPEIDQSLGNVIAIQNSCLDMQIACEVQMFLSASRSAKGNPLRSPVG